ncbi:SdrD B-like domain-containing protein [Spirosoma pollinicola]|uniref:SD-repeat containing protein B domain-containing protein n=1 Tax=Spirosoma pollinicola TaxID=2057025 RepID=A0A2K8YYJ0_9BACT|nr:SdrD B-like domain-containing protein [Spirosoma pollinicola]AUD02649.1 hypothetical protein CWM47_12870 [Spirosoma pollinicola]
MEKYLSIYLTRTAHHLFHVFVAWLYRLLNLHEQVATRFLVFARSTLQPKPFHIQRLNFWQRAMCFLRSRWTDEQPETNWLMSGLNFVAYPVDSIRTGRWGVLTVLPLLFIAFCTLMIPEQAQAQSPVSYSYACSSATMLVSDFNASFTERTTTAFPFPNPAGAGQMPTGTCSLGQNSGNDGIAVDPVRNLAYIVNDKSVRVYDYALGTFTTTYTYPTTDGLYDVALSRDQASLYIAVRNAGTSTIGVLQVDVATGAILASRPTADFIGTNGQLWGIAVDPTTGAVYVSGGYRAFPYIFDQILSLPANLSGTPTPIYTDTIQDDEILGLTFAPDATLWAATLNGRLIHLTGSGSVLGTFAAPASLSPASGSMQAYDLAIGPDGNLYIATFVGPCVMKFDVSTSSFSSYIPNVPGVLGKGIAFVCGTFKCPIASLGDYVFLDTNKNGIQDTGDTPISGVTATLYTNGVASATTVTDVSGLYSFTGLTPGTSNSYVVGFTAPSGYTATAQNAGSDDTKDSDADPTTGKTQSVTLAVGENNPTLDAGFYLLTASLGDYVFEDVNANGIQEPTDKPIAGVTVTLLSSGTLVANTTTNASGLYSFTGLTPGVPYSVSFTAPTGFTATTQNTGSDDALDSDGNPVTGLTGVYTLTANENNTTVDMGYYKPASLGDFVFVDANKSGQQDAGESPMPGVIVTLVSNGTVIATTTTNSSGLYRFTGLTPDVPYSVSFTTPVGYTATTPLSGTDKTVDSDPVNGITASVTLASGENNPTLDAGFYLAPAMSVTLTSAPVCNSATNTYVATATVSLTSASAGTLTITDNGTTIGTISITAGQATATLSVTGVSDAASHTLVGTFNGLTATATYTAPIPCTVCSTSITMASLPNGQVGTAYSQTLTASGGTAPYTYAVRGTLPAGLTLNPLTGEIAGTPTAAAASSFTITVSDARSCSDAQPMTIMTSVAPVCSMTATATLTTCNTATNTYTVTGSVSATNTTGNQSLTISVASAYTVVTLTGNGPVSYTLTGLDSDGLTHMVTVMSSATACGMTSVTYTAPVACTACSVTLTATSLPIGMVGQPYSASLTAAGGTAPYSFSLVGGLLPTGLTLNTSTGLISGTPTNAGSFSTTIRVTDSKGCTISAPLNVIKIDMNPVCSMHVTATPGQCTTATNTYTVTGTISLTSNTTGGTLTLTDGMNSTTLSISNSATSVAYSLTGLNSDGSSHTITAILSGCGNTSTTYTAPQSCTYTCQPPIHVCKGSDYAYVLTTTTGQSSYQWYRDGIAISGATLSSYTATQAGSYSVVANGNSLDQFPNGACCPVIIVEDSIANYQAQAQATTCNSSTANADGRILVINWKLSANDTTTYHYQVSLGSSFNAAQLIAGSISTLVPASGVLVANLANPTSVSGQTYTVRITSGLGCYRDVVVTLLQTSCACPPAKCVPFTILRIR